MDELDHFIRVDFSRFKAFESFSVNLRHFNILVGPNNAGKSTILAAFRILSAAMRKAGTRKADVVNGPQGPSPGYAIDLGTISIAEENIFYNYDDSEPASVKFTLSNKNTLLLYFPEQRFAISSLMLLASLHALLQRFDQISIAQSDLFQSLGLLSISKTCLKKKLHALHF